MGERFWEGVTKARAEHAKELRGGWVSNAVLPVKARSSRHCRMDHLQNSQLFPRCLRERIHGAAKAVAFSLRAATSVLRSSLV